MTKRERQQRATHKARKAKAREKQKRDRYMGFYQVKARQQRRTERRILTPVVGAGMAHAAVAALFAMLDRAERERRMSGDLLSVASGGRP
jgi:hypothetical protein